MIIIIIIINLPFAVIRNYDVECSKEEVELLVNKISRVLGRNLILVVVYGSVQLLLLLRRHLLLEIHDNFVSGT